jgi:predicted HTH transcriptional regulator
MPIPTADLLGHQALRERVYAALDTCVETQGIEFKESATWKVLQAKIVRTGLAMANLRDGGVIIIGVSQRDDRWSAAGIAEEHLATYDADTVAEHIDQFSSPALTVRLVLVEYRDGRNFLAIEVSEFTDTPIVCRRDASDLRQGAIYVRPPGHARTSEVRTAQELHDLLELAAEKRARRILETARRVGLEAPAAARPFDDELEGL